MSGHFMSPQYVQPRAGSLKKIVALAGIERTKCLCPFLVASAAVMCPARTGAGAATSPARAGAATGRRAAAHASARGRYGLHLR